MNTIDLVNSEGSILTLTKEASDDLFSITDENNRELVKLTKSALILFLTGDILITDSKNREWDYPRIDKGMKVNNDDLLNFLG